jgi:hypothetical protein
MRAIGLLRDRNGRADLLPPVRDVARRRHRRKTLTPPPGFRITSLLREKRQIGSTEGGGSAMVRLIPEMANIGSAMMASLTSSEGRARALGVLKGIIKVMRYIGGGPTAALEALAHRCAASGHAEGEAQCLRGLAEIALIQSRHDEARGLYEEARERYVRTRTLSGEAYCLVSLAQIAEATGEHDVACTLYAEAEARYRETLRTDWVQWIVGKRQALHCPESEPATRPST